MTRGAWAGFPDYVQIASGVTLRGGGYTIRLENPAVQWQGDKIRPDRDVAVLRVGANCLLENVTIDGQEAKWRTGPPTTWLFVNVGVNSTGRLTANKVTVRGIRGTVNGAATVTPAIEAFGFLVNGTYDGGSVLTDCEVSGCPSEADLGGESPYISCFIIGHGDLDNDVTTSLVKNCRALVKNAWAGFAASRCTLFTGCKGVGLRTAAHFDTREVRKVRYEKCDFTDIRQGPSLVSVDKTGKGDIAFVDCVFAFGPEASHLLSMWDENGTGAEIGPLLFSRCKFSWPAGRKPIMAVTASNLRPIVFSQSPLPEGYVLPAGDAARKQIVLVE